MWSVYENSKYENPMLKQVKHMHFVAKSLLPFSPLFHLSLYKSIQIVLFSKHCMEIALARILKISWFYVKKKKNYFKQFIENVQE